MQRTLKSSLPAIVLALTSACGHYYHGYYPGPEGALVVEEGTVIAESSEGVLVIEDTSGGAYADATTSVAVEADATVVVEGSMVVTGTTSGTWTAQRGWSGLDARGQVGLASGGASETGGVMLASGGASETGGVMLASGEASETGGVMLASGGGSETGGVMLASGGGGERRITTPAAIPVVDASCGIPRIGAIGASGTGVGLSGLVGPGIHVSCEACAHEDTIAALSMLGALSSLSLGGDAGLMTSPGVRVETSLAHDALPSSGGASSLVVRATGGPRPSVPVPVRVHLVIDASASMEMRWSEVQDAALALVGRLPADDELSIVVYSTNARVALPPTRVGDGSAARAVIRSLTCSGQTNIEAGLRAAYGTLAPDGGSVVLLLSDGVPDGGLSTPTELGTLAADARSRMGATTLTIGLGNQFHAGILRAVANRGGGDFRVAPSATDLAQLLTAELEAHANIVARDVAVDVALAPGVTLDASFDANGVDAGVRIEGGHVSIRIAALSAGETRTIVLPIAIATPGAVATVEGHASVGGALVQGERALSVRASAQAIPAGGLAATLDADLASALALSASAVENGQTAAASAALRAHAERARVIASGDPAILARVQAALSFAAGLDATVPGASWGARRQASYAMLEWSAGLGR